MVFRFSITTVLCCALASALLSQRTQAQSFGVDLHASMMPASGGMGGTSIARPQDLQGALAGNPASLTQFQGTQFSFGGGWAEPTIKIDNDATLPIMEVVPFSERSGTPGAALGNVAVTQDYSVFGLPVTMGLGLLTASGLGVDYRDAVGDLDEVNAANGTSTLLQALDIGVGVGVLLTERLSVGAEMVVTAATLDGPFVGIGAAVPAYGLRGNFGLAYDVGDHTTLGFRWLTLQSFQFEDAILLEIGAGPIFSTALDIEFDRPETFSLGIANDALMDGRLLLAADVMLQKFSEADFLGAIWTDQFVFQTGAQYQLSRKIRLRMGYAYAENIMRGDVAGNIGGVIPPDVVQGGLQYIQAQFPAINEHRITGGIGVKNFLPGVDLDLYAGGMFEADEQLGDTGVSVESYWIGMGTTWRFGRGACERLPIPNQWSENSDVGLGLF